MLLIGLSMKMFLWVETFYRLRSAKDEKKLETNWAGGLYNVPEQLLFF